VKIRIDDLPNINPCYKQLNNGTFVEDPEMKKYIKNDHCIIPDYECDGACYGIWQHSGPNRPQIFGLQICNHEGIMENMCHKDHITVQKNCVKNLTVKETKEVYNQQENNKTTHETCCCTTDFCTDQLIMNYANLTGIETPVFQPDSNWMKYVLLGTVCSIIIFASILAYIWYKYKMQAYSKSTEHELQNMLDPSQKTGKKSNKHSKNTQHNSNQPQFNNNQFTINNPKQTANKSTLEFNDSRGIETFPDDDSGSGRRMNLNTGIPNNVTTRSIVDTSAILNFQNNEMNNSPFSAFQSTLKKTSDGQNHAQKHKNNNPSPSNFADQPETFKNFSSTHPNSTIPIPKLQRAIAKGSYGQVWLGFVENAKTQVRTEYAVKVFSRMERNSFDNEVTVYRCHEEMSLHDNILKFIDSKEFHDQEYWLITEYYPLGSLTDFIKQNTLKEVELGQIAISIISGLAFLHEDTTTKLVIAHRDFKSKNVLVKKLPDGRLHAVIADFGLAKRFVKGQQPNDNQPQIGTRRYMAPELLEGAINFQIPSFLRIDIYAFSLVLWEMMERCTFDWHFPDYECNRYMLPFEKELGLHPAQDELHNMVVFYHTGCNRPYIRNMWRKYAGKHWGKYCRTIEECWDYDADARLSAGCIEKRLKDIFSALATESSKNLVPEETMKLCLREEENLLVARNQEIARQMQELNGANNGNITDEAWAKMPMPPRPLF
jgi:hypothetical protein